MPKFVRLEQRPDYVSSAGAELFHHLVNNGSESYFPGQLKERKKYMNIVEKFKF